MQLIDFRFAEGPTVKGYQHYIYRLEGDNTLNVYFDGGHRLFHAVEFTNSENKLELEFKGHFFISSILASILACNSLSLLANVFASFNVLSASWVAPCNR